MVFACCNQCAMCRVGTVVGLEPTRLWDKWIGHREDLLMQFKRCMPCFDIVRLASLRAQEDESLMQVGESITWLEKRALASVQKTSGR